MESRELLSDAFGRIVEAFERAVTGLDAEQLSWRPDPGANSIAWLTWHATRVQDDHVAHLAGTGQVWADDGFEQRFGLDFDARDIGFGHDADQVASVHPEPDLLMEYLVAVTSRTREYLGRVDGDELDRVVDTNWDPPVTAGVRLVSVIDDSIEHAGQACYVRGMLDRRR